MTSGTENASESVILDTNVALALWLFADPRLGALRDALASQRLVWLVTQPMLDELAHEIRAERCERYGTTVANVRAAIAQTQPWLRPTPAPAEQPATGLRCSDPKDQMFIDLAVAERTPWLFSRDRAVLKLRGRLLALGVTARAPEGWPVAAEHSR